MSNITKHKLKKIKDLFTVLRLTLMQAHIYTDLLNYSFTKLDSLVKKNKLSKPKQVKTKQTKTTQVKTTQVKTKQVETNNVKTKQVKTNNVKTKQVETNNVKTKQVKTIKLYTDGSCTAKYGKRQAGCGVHFPNKELDDIEQVFICSNPTNQRAELYAIYLGLKKIIDNLNVKEIIVYTDSMYSIKCVTEWYKKWKNNNWINSKGENVLNKDIIELILNIQNNFKGKISYNHVKGHSGDIYNDIADKLATNASAKKAKEDYNIIIK